MVVSTAPHVRESYRLWHRFALPVEGGNRDAYAVPNSVASQLNSAYTIMVTSMVMNLWCILFAIAFFLMLRRQNNKPHIVSTSLWNKRSSLTDSFLELIQPSTTTGKKDHWRQWWIYPAILVVVVCWVAQNVLSIIVPPYILIGNAAPVNPSAIYAPSNADTSPAARARVFSLDVPSALRAVGSAQVASKDVLAKASVFQTQLPPLSPDQPMLRVDYNYTVTGADLGLQKYPTLLLSVSGACTTEYSWLVSSETSNDTSLGAFTTDTYAPFGDSSRDPVYLSAFDGPAPIGFFYHGSADSATPGNRTWAAIISSVDRVSFTPGTDPIYLTSSSTPNSSLASTDFYVAPGRPALSCWQLDTWSYNGATSTAVGLNSSALPGLNLSPGMQVILARYLGNPKIVDIGRQLGLSNLVSSTTSLGSIFDASQSGTFIDLQRLVLASYIASANTLTDLTLYPPLNTTDGEVQLDNLATDDDTGDVKDGVADFVIWSSDISTLSIKALVIIPALSLLFWLLALGLLTWSPLRTVNALDATVLHRTLEENYPEARPHFDRQGGRGFSWVVHRDDPTAVGLREVAEGDEEAARHEQRTVTEKVVARVDGMEVRENKEEH